MSIDNKDKFYESLSNVRLDAYDRFFKLENNKDKLSFIYLALQDITSSFYPLFQMIEVTLRNKIHKALEKEYGTPYWYTELYLNDRTENHFFEAKKKSKTKTSNHFVCEVPFGAWVNLLYPINRGAISASELSTLQQDEKDKLARIEKFWGNKLNDIFSGRNNKSIKNIFEELKDINALRNRFSHFEPLWKPNRRKSSHVKIGDEFNTSCNILHAKHQKILAAISICCPETSSFMSKNTIDIFNTKIAFYKEEWEKRK